MKAQTLPSISITLKPSFVILGCYFLISILCCISIYISSITSIVKILSLIIVVICFTYVVLRDVLLYLPWSWHVISVTSIGELRLKNKRNQIFKIQLLPSTFNHPVLMVLNFKRTPFLLGWRCSVMLTPWQVDDVQAFRRLRIWLKWWPHHPDLVLDSAFDE